MTVSNGIVTIASSGTPQQISSNDTQARWALVTCPATNSGTVYIGSSSVLASSKNGAPVFAGGSIFLPPGINASYNLAQFYADSTSSGDKVSFLYVTF
jgi:hypothetical protein